MHSGNVAHAMEPVGFRERMNRSPKITFAIIFAVILSALAYAYVGSRESTTVSEPRFFYTADDGKTWFKDSAYLPVPFEKDGAQVVRARVFTDGTKERVTYLERFKAPVQARLAQELKDAQQAGRPASTAFQSAGIGPTSIEVKAPGHGSWIPINSLNQTGKIIAQFEATPNGRLTSVDP